MERGKWEGGVKAEHASREAAPPGENDFHFVQKALRVEDLIESPFGVPVQPPPGVERARGGSGCVVRRPGAANRARRGRELEAAFNRRGTYPRASTLCIRLTYRVVLESAAANGCPREPA
jgi:hypothetical protein